MAFPGLPSLRRLRRRRVTRRLLSDPRDEGEDEDIVLDGEVHHHWVSYTVPVLEGLLALISLVLVAVVSAQVAWLFLLLALGVGTHAALRALRTFMDVFVVTNFRVFRVTGLPGLGPTKYASTPISRILDITVDQSALGQALGYGHFTFESAAQEQGLREIKFVSRPLERNRLIQTEQLRLLRRQRRT